MTMYGLAKTAKKLFSSFYPQTETALFVQKKYKMRQSRANIAENCYMKTKEMAVLPKSRGHGGLGDVKIETLRRMREIAAKRGQTLLEALLKKGFRETDAKELVNRLDTSELVEEMEIDNKTSNTKKRHLSGWFRILILSSVLWFIGVLIAIDPWYRSGSAGRGRRGGSFGYSNWDDFFLIGVLPIIVLWGIVWIVRGFRNTRK